MESNLIKNDATTSIFVYFELQTTPINTEELHSAL